MRLLKRIVEFIFIFLVPLMLLLFGLKINKEYDENNNLTNQYLTYENGIFREYNDNIQYINYLHLNQKLKNNVSPFQNKENWLDSNNIMDISNGNFRIRSNSDNQVVFQDFDIVSGHKYYLLTTYYAYQNSNKILTYFGTYNYIQCNSGQNTYKNIFVGSGDLGRVGFELTNSGNTLAFADYEIIDLTQMYGVGFEPSLQDISSNEIFSSQYEYIDNQIIEIKSNDIISSDYEINYTWYNEALVKLSDTLQFNNNFMIQFMFIYVILICLNLLLWYVFYVPFDMLFGLLLRKLDYYK